uniref:(northern house mosquito) hypothetical protein n=1 Tax=Culex pipiens TaxID=7175 RepID=A0A8D8HI28_CULPI
MSAGPVLPTSGENVDQKCPTSPAPTGSTAHHRKHQRRRCGTTPRQQSNAAHPADLRPGSDLEPVPSGPPRAGQTGRSVRRSGPRAGHVDAGVEAPLAYAALVLLQPVPAHEAWPDRA